MLMWGWILLNHRPVKLRRFETYQEFVKDNYGVAANEV